MRIHKANPHASLRDDIAVLTCLSGSAAFLGWVLMRHEWNSCPSRSKSRSRSKAAERSARSTQSKSPLLAKDARNGAPRSVVREALRHFPVSRKRGETWGSRYQAQRPIKSLFLFRLLLFGFFLRRGSPGWDDSVHARIRDRLAEGLMCVGDQDVHHVAGIGLRAQFGQQFCEVGVAHALDCLLGKLPRFIQLGHDGSPVCC